MNIEEFRGYCIQKEDVEESTPFGPDVLVLKVANKMFALCDILEFKRINLKCDPDLATELRERYPEVSPAYHMNKIHWNSVNPNGSLSNKQIKDWIDHSYNLVIQSMSKAKKKAWLLEHGKGEI